MASLTCAARNPILEEVGAVRVGGAVAVVGAEVVHRLAETARVVLRAVEEEVLEQVSEAGSAALLVARSDVIPEIHRDHRHGMIRVHDQRQPVLQHERAVRDVERLAREHRLLRRAGHGESQKKRGNQREVTHTLSRLNDTT
jgi:hypothetical protein